MISAPSDSALRLRGGDVVLAVDGRAPSSPSHLLRILRSYETGETFKLDIMRNRKRETVNARIGERDEVAPAPSCAPAHRCPSGTLVYLRPTLEGTMGILWTLIIGLVVGAIAKFLMPGKDPGGFIVTMLLGVAGALLAGFLGRALGWYANPGEGPGIIASIIGAMLLLLIYRLFVGRRGTTVP